MNDDRANILEEALTRFMSICSRGEQPDIDEFIGQYPQCKAQLKKRIQDLQEIDSLFDSLVHADESDFEDSVIKGNLIGRRIRSFEITKVIGRGGMGVVYLAHDNKLNRSVAIKSMPAKLAVDLTTRTRFRREAELLASLNHPNIAVIHEIIEEEESVYLVLEYVHGETLAERIEGEPLELDVALSIGQQIAEAVSAAHKKGIVHGDLKPGNIKIMPDGRVKVLDFGLAKPSVSKDKSDEVTVTESGRIMGTPAYMSPEQARGKDTDHRTDIWALGCIIYQMLTGRLPFEGKTATDTLAYIIEHEPDWERLPQKTPTKIHNLLRRCLEKDMDQRLGDITDAAIEIAEILSTQTQPLAGRLRKTAMIICATIIITLTGVAVWFTLAPSREIRLVVLPFENLGSVEDDYFGNILMDDITTRLASIHGLHVYKSKEKGAKQIAKELGVDYILEGTLQRAQQSDPNSSIKIKSQLIRASDDSLVWEQSYDDVREVLRKQSDLTEKVVQTMDIKLLPLEQRALTSMPTVNKEAYIHYLRGNEYSSRPYQDEENPMIAIQMYEKAVELDDKFALAHARLSEAHSGMYWFHDRSEERLEMAREESEIALEFDPELPEAHWARGVYYYWGHRNYALALKEFETARKSQPNNSQILKFIAFVKRRQGKYEEALINLKKASEFDPLSSNLTMALGNTFRDMRKYIEAERSYERAILLAPDEDEPHLRKADLYLVWKGSIQKALEALERASQYINFADNQRIAHLQFRLDVLEGNYQGALARLPLTSPSMDALDYPDALRYAHVYGLMGDQESERKFFEELRSILESRVNKYPNSAESHCRLGIAYAGLGYKEEAIQEGRYGVKLVPYAVNSEAHFNATKDLAAIYMIIGEYDMAIDKIEYLLTKPGELSIPLLQLDPIWAPLRNHPHFQRLIKPKS